MSAEGNKTPQTGTRLGTCVDCADLLTDPENVSPALRFQKNEANVATLRHFEVKNKRKWAKRRPRGWSELCSPNNRLNPKENLHHVKSDQTSHATNWNPARIGLEKRAETLQLKLNVAQLFTIKPRSSLRFECCFDPKFGLFWGLHF